MNRQLVLLMTPIISFLIIQVFIYTFGYMSHPIYNNKYTFGNATVIGTYEFSRMTHNTIVYYGHVSLNISGVLHGFDTRLYSLDARHPQNAIQYFSDNFHDMYQIGTQFRCAYADDDIVCGLQLFIIQVAYYTILLLLLISSYIMIYYWHKMLDKEHNE